MVDNQKFCITCAHYVRKSPLGKSSSGDCTLDPAWAMVKLPVTHWCSHWISGIQRFSNEIYKSPDATDIPAVIVKPDTTIQTELNTIIDTASSKKSPKVR
ncbi:MAG: hypothetical protein WC877_00945 [Dehalococcoidales bacterium]|jgi:hypothetical protein